MTTRSASTKLRATTPAKLPFCEVRLQPRMMLLCRQHDNEERVYKTESHDSCETLLLSPSHHQKTITAHAGHYADATPPQLQPKYGGKRFEATKPDGGSKNAPSDSER